MNYHLPTKQMYSYIQQFYVSTTKIITIVKRRQHVTSTSNVLLKNHFGSFEEVLPNNKNFLSTSHGTAVKTFLQDFRHSCWLGYRMKEELIKTFMTSGLGKQKHTGGQSLNLIKLKHL